MILMVFTLVSFGQTENKSVVEVVVKDAITGEELKDVEVSMKDKNSPLDHLGNTNSLGIIVVKNRTPGEVLFFTFEKEGYEKFEDKHTVASIFLENECRILLTPIKPKVFTFSGKLIDHETKNPISNAAVKVAGINTVTSSVKSGRNGQFEVQNPQFKIGVELEITIFKEEYESVTKKHIISSNNNLNNLGDIHLKRVAIVNEKSDDKEIQKAPPRKLTSFQGFIGILGVAGGGMMIYNGISVYNNEAKPIYSKYETHTIESEFLENTPTYNFSNRSEAYDEATRLKNSSNKKIGIGSGLAVAGIILILEKYKVINLFGKKKNKDTSLVLFNDNDFSSLGLRYNF
jgi:hypothetical protein